MMLWKFWLACSLVALLSACSSLSAGCRQGAEPCPQYGQVDGEVANGTSCAVFAQNQHFCTYDSQGRFKGESVKLGTGVCFCLSASSSAKDSAIANSTEVACSPTLRSASL